MRMNPVIFTVSNPFILLSMVKLSAAVNHFVRATPLFYVTSRGINTEDLERSGSESEDNFDEGSELNEDGTESDDDGAGI